MVPRPATAPEIMPSTDGLPRVFHSIAIQVAAPAEAARCVHPFSVPQHESAQFGVEERLGRSEVGRREWLVVIAAWPHALHEDDLPLGIQPQSRASRIAARAERDPSARPGRLAARVPVDGRLRGVDAERGDRVTGGELGQTGPFRQVGVEEPLHGRERRLGHFFDPFRRVVPRPPPRGFAPAFAPERVPEGRPRVAARDGPPMRSTSPRK